MKQIIFYILFVATTLLHAQKLKKSDLLKIEKDIYKTAISNYDWDVAKNAIYHITELEGKSSTYMDSLAYIYFNTNKFVSAVKVADKILGQRKNQAILELKAVSLEKLNLPKDAINIYEKIYAKQKTVALAYKLASLQAQLKRSVEAYQTLRSAENLKFPKNVQIAFPTAKKGKQQQIPLKAAYYNLMAMTAYDLHNFDMAIQYFDKALKIKPDFFVAKQNKQAIELMKKKLENQNPPPPEKNNKPPKSDK